MTPFVTRRLTASRLLLSCSWSSAALLSRPVPAGPLRLLQIPRLILASGPRDRRENGAIHRSPNIPYDAHTF